MREVSVVGWNAEGMFVEGSKTRRGTPADACATLDRLDADIVFIPEFGDTSRVSEITRDSIHRLGYKLMLFSYGEQFLETYGAALLTRMPLYASEIHAFRNTKRAFTETTVEISPGELLRVIGIHLDDRMEITRLSQVDDVMEVLECDTVTPTIIVGDFNAMNRRALFARFARTSIAEYFGERLPNSHIRSVVHRVRDMALGTTIERFTCHQMLTNLDPACQRTISAKQCGLEWMPSLRLAKLDWMFGTHTIRQVSYKVLPDSGSDHRATQATILVKQQ